LSSAGANTIELGPRHKRRREEHDRVEITSVTEERRANQETRRQEIEIEHLQFEKDRVSATDVREDRRLRVIGEQNELYRRERLDNSNIQLKIMSVLDEMLRKMQ
jgi:hypothetical protein